MGQTATPIDNGNEIKVAIDQITVFSPSRNIQYVQKLVSNAISFKLSLIENVYVMERPMVKYSQQSKYNQQSQEFDFVVNGLVSETNGIYLIDINITAGRGGQGHFTSITSDLMTSEELLTGINNLSDKVVQYVIRDESLALTAIGVSCFQFDKTGRNWEYKNIFGEDVALQIIYELSGQQELKFEPWPEPTSFCDVNFDDLQISDYENVPDRILSGKYKIERGGKVKLETSLYVKEFQRSFVISILDGYDASLFEINLNETGGFLGATTASYLYQDIIQGLKYFNPQQGDIDLSLFESNLSASDLIEQSLEFLQDKKLYIAAQLAIQATSREPSNSEAYIQLARIKAAQGRNAEANYYSSIAEGLLTSGISEDISKGDILFNKSDFHGAIASYRKALSYDVDDFTVNLKLAKSFKEIYQLDSASKYFEVASNAGSLSPSDEYKYVNVLVNNDNTTKAIGLLEDLVNRTPDNIEYRQSLSRLLSQEAWMNYYLGNIDESFELALHSNELDPNINAYDNLRYIFFDRREFEDMEQIIDLALELNVYSTDIYLEQGISLLYAYITFGSETDYFDMAIQYLKKYEEVDGRDPSYLNYLAYLYTDKKEYATAIMYYKKHNEIVFDPDVSLNLCELLIITDDYFGSMFFLSLFEKEIGNEFTAYYRSLWLYLTIISKNLVELDTKGEEKELDLLLKENPEIYSEWTFEPIDEKLQELKRIQPELSDNINKIEEITAQLKSVFAEDLELKMKK